MRKFGRGQPFQKSWGIALFLLTLFGLVQPFGWALLDRNNNGVSDVYEALHPGIAETLDIDVDGDGFTGRQEADLGTDLEDPNSEFSIKISHDSNAENDVLSIQTQPGKRYRIEQSPDLLAWSSLGDDILGDGGLAVRAVSTVIRRNFFRANYLGDIDADGDGLTAWEESELGTSDAEIDSDADLLGDYWETFYGMNPVKQDSDEDGLWDADEDPDGDGLINFWESFLGRDPTDPDTDDNGLDDSHEDIDGDGMTEGEEIQFGFDFFQSANAFEDADGDGYPNIAEIKRGSLPKDAASFPPPDIVVALPTIDSPHLVQNAINQLAAQLVNFGIIKLGPGTYRENLYCAGRSIVLVGDGSFSGSRLDGQSKGPVIYGDKDCVLIGLRLENGNSQIGGGFLISGARIRATNCLLVDNLAARGGGAGIYNARAWLQNCTFLRNRASTEAAGIFVTGTKGEVWVESSIIWDKKMGDESGPIQEISGSNSNLIHVANSDVFHPDGSSFYGLGNFSIDPNINPDGLLASDSPCINIFAATASCPLLDLHREPRNDGFPDVGADEYVDGNANLLPDAWESSYLPFEIGSWDDDPDEDGVINRDEFKQGTRAVGPVPPAPESLEVHLINQNQANIQWNFRISPAQSRWVIERKQGSGDYSAVCIQTNSANWIDTGLLPGQSYTYRVKLISEGSHSAYSEEVIISIPESLLITGIPWQNARLWLSADAVMTSGPVARWINRINPSEAAEQTYDYWRPSLEVSSICNRPAIRFDGIGSHLVLPDMLSVLSEGEIFVVHKTAVPENGRYYGFIRMGNASYGPNDSDNVRGWSWYPTSSGRLVDGFGSTESHDLGVPITPILDAHVYNASSSAFEWSSRLNGFPQYSTSTNTVAFTTTPAIGYSGWIYQGDIAEIIVFSRTLNSNERDAVNSYLSARYRIANVNADRDGDGLLDSIERDIGTDIFAADSDSDGLPDGWEAVHGLNPLFDDALLDLDEDGMPNNWEFWHGLNPSIDDSVSDGDSDGLSSLQEFQLGTNPNEADSDGDGVDDEAEFIVNKTNPTVSDSDLDPDNNGLSHLEEYQLGVSLWRTNATGSNPNIRLRVFTVLY